MTPIEEIRVRVAKAEDEWGKLHDEVLERYGSVERMDTYANSAGPGGKKAADLRKKYDHAKKELRLAKSDLKRMRDEGPSPWRKRPAPDRWNWTASPPQTYSASAMGRRITVPCRRLGCKGRP
jgi:hypothetical protein